MMATGSKNTDDHVHSFPIRASIQALFRSAQVCSFGVPPSDVR